MSFLNGNNFADRLAAAAKARKAMVEKFIANSKYDPNDPAVIERETKRKAILEARVVRDAERARRGNRWGAADRMEESAVVWQHDKLPGRAKNHHDLFIEKLQLLQIVLLI